jgi:DNA-binding HxlR family transcriptional regulator
VAAVVGDAYTLLIVRDLIESPKRFTELAESLKGTSSRTLSEKLKFLGGNGIIERHMDKCNSKRSCPYHLTPKGRALNNVIKAMRKFGDEWVKEEKDTKAPVTKGKK